jgi:hypothetical protein
MRKIVSIAKGVSDWSVSKNRMFLRESEVDLGTLLSLPRIRGDWY